MKSQLYRHCIYTKSDDQRKIQFSREKGELTTDLDEL